MHIGVNQRSECLRTLHRRIQIEAQLGKEREVRAEPGRGDDLVNGPDHLIVTGDQDSFSGLGQAPDLEAADQLQALRFYQPLYALAQRSASREGIIDPTSEEVV